MHPIPFFDRHAKPSRRGVDRNNGSGPFIVAYKSLIQSTPSKAEPERLFLPSLRSLNQLDLGS